MQKIIHQIIIVAAILIVSACGQAKIENSTKVNIPKTGKAPDESVRLQYNLEQMRTDVTLKYVVEMEMKFSLFNADDKTKTLKISPILISCNIDLICTSVSDDSRKVYFDLVFTHLQIEGNGGYFNFEFETGKPAEPLNPQIEGFKLLSEKRLPIFVEKRGITGIDFQSFKQKYQISDDQLTDDTQNRITRLVRTIFIQYPKDPIAGLKGFKAASPIAGSYRVDSQTSNGEFFLLKPVRTATPRHLVSESLSGWIYVQNRYGFIQKGELLQQRVQVLNDNGVKMSAESYFKLKIERK